jgi:hypothetical protein
LKIHKEHAEDPAAEIKAWDEEIRKEVEELKEEHQDEYNRQLDEYSNKLTLWKKRREAVVGLNKIFRTTIGCAFWDSRLYS